MARTWRRLSKDDRAAYGSRKQRAPRREAGDDFGGTRGKNRTAMKHLDPSAFEDEWDDLDEDFESTHSR